MSFTEGTECGMPYMNRFGYGVWLCVVLQEVDSIAH